LLVHFVTMADVDSPTKAEEEPKYEGQEEENDEVRNDLCLALTRTHLHLRSYSQSSGAILDN
jgi:hypothetical protein